MKYTNLGGTDIKVSRICMGCMGFGDAGNGQHGWTVNEETTREIIRHGLESGINFYDTATKLHHVDAPVHATELELTSEELQYLEEAYVPHALSGVMAQNTPAARTEKHVWTRNGAYAEK